MKKILLPILFLATFTFACKNEDNTVEPMSLQAVAKSQSITFRVGQTVKLEDGVKVTLLGITEDSRCPKNTTCFWAGRVVAEFQVQGRDDTVVESLTDNPANDPSLSTSFKAFGHVFTLVDVMPYPDGTPIDQRDYTVEIMVD